MALEILSNEEKYVDSTTPSPRVGLCRKMCSYHEQCTADEQNDCGDLTFCTQTRRIVKVLVALVEDLPGALTAER